MPYDRVPLVDDDTLSFPPRTMQAILAYVEEHTEVLGGGGVDGKSVELRVFSGFLQWRQTAGEWANLIPIIDLVGSAGADSTVPGPPGEDGTNGTDGTNGLSSYEIAVSRGFIGTEPEWLLSLRGADGTDGADGLQGEKGDKGDPGISAPFVTVTTGEEARPDAPLALWVGGSVQPTNMAIGDIWFSEAAPVDPPDEEPPVETPTTAWAARSTISSTRNGTTGHTATFTAATAGQLLVAILTAPAAITTPTGWTRQAASLDGVDLGVFTKIATAGESSASITLSAANYPLAGAVYSFVSGTTFQGEQHAIAPMDGANPPLTGLTGTNVAFAVAAKGGVDTVSGIAWTGATEDVELIIAPGVTDGIVLGVAVDPAFTGSSFAATSVITGQGANKQVITFAVKKP